MKRSLLPPFLVLTALCSLITGNAQAELTYLAPRNTEVPFPYLQEGTRHWPILRQTLPKHTKVHFTATVDDTILAEGAVLSLPGLTLSLNDAQRLTIVAEEQETPLEFSVDIVLTLPDGTTEKQALLVIPAPPQRPLSYLADFGDDLIRIFNNHSSDGRWRPVTKDAFDQYFRRCQLHGIDRLIMWMSPMPYITDPANYAPEDWARYEAQAKALNESPIFLDLIAERLKGAKEGQWGRHISWDWIRQLNHYRLMREFGPMLSESAVDHGIKLTASFRPFETALTKYYELPTFEQDGTHLWNFLPMATPTINYKTDKTAFAHYRTILAEMGMPEKGQIGRIELPGVTNVEAFLKRYHEKGDNLRIVASNYPPLLEDTLVLQRQPDASFELVKFADFADKAEAKQKIITDFKVYAEGDSVYIDALDVNSDIRFLILSNPAAAEEALSLTTITPVKLFAKAGNALGRENVYWVLDDEQELSNITRVPGIPDAGNQATEFDTTQKGYKHLYLKGDAHTALKNRMIVIDLGAPYSVEMLDVNQPAMRANIVKEMKTMLDLPAFDELFVNTRSHVQLAAYQGDGTEGIKPLVYYRQKHMGSVHLGIDRAYAPRAVAHDPVLKEWAKDPKLVERITTWQPGAWDDRCQQEDSPYRWRYARNKAVADGIRLLLQDFETQFPGVRVRAVIPMGEESAHRVLDQVETLNKPDGTLYDRKYNGIWTTINHIRSIGEGMAMLDLTGLNTEPVLFGVRGIPDDAPFDAHFQESLKDFSTNRGSNFKGPRSFFFEAQSTLRRKDYDVARKQRENIICTVLSFEEEVDEVILYESADWLYYLSFSDRDLSGNYFIERCTDIDKQ